MGLNTLTKRLKRAVAVKVAATETVAVVPAVIRTSGAGRGTSTSVKGISTSLIPGNTGCLGGGGVGALEGGGAFSCSELTPPLTPGGALRVLGGATRGV